MQRSFSYNPGGGGKGRGGSGPAEDLRPVSEVEAGVNFRLAGSVRGQVAGSLGKVRVHSLHPEVPDIQHASPWRGLGSGNQWAGRRCVKLHSRGFGV